VAFDRVPTKVLPRRCVWAAAADEKIRFPRRDRVVACCALWQTDSLANARPEL
jgi:hypothetical protein